jgi:squalene-hopene/tetraprenyl-beta-curcumene cyclase
MQNPDGSWPTFVRNSRMPFDHDDPYITGQVLWALAALGPEVSRGKQARRALEYLRRKQHEDGSFDSLWFRKYTRGTAMVVEALANLGLKDDPMFVPALEWLLTHQNDDGGWGDGRGAHSTAEETAWAVSALLLTEPVRFRRAVEGGVQWLVDHQREDGGWDEENVAIYYSFVIYSNSFYAIGYPLVALSRYLRSELAR